MFFLFILMDLRSSGGILNHSLKGDESFFLSGKLKNGGQFQTNLSG